MLQADRFEALNPVSVPLPTSKTPGTQAVHPPSKRPHRLARLRRAEGLTIDALAEQVGLDPRDLRRWEQNGSIPAEVQVRLAARFGVDTSWLVGTESLPTETVRLDPSRRRFPSRPTIRRNRLAALRSAEGMTQPILARELGVAREDLARWEGGAPIPAEHEAALAERFGVTVDWLTGRETLDSEIIPTAPDERG